MSPLPALPRRWLLGTLGAAVVSLGAVSLIIGPSGWWFTGAPAAPRIDADVFWLIVTQVRAPRTLLALAVGASLGLSGAVLQGLLHNPLAEPSLIGSSSTAALGAVLTFYFGASTASSFALPLGGIAGALVGLALIVVLATHGGTLLLILAGLAINTLAGALTSLALSFAPSPYAALEIVFWLLGSLADRSFDHVLVAAPFMLAGWLCLSCLGRPIDALALGEEAAASMGFHLLRARLLALTGVGLCVGACVSVAGNIAFVGLIVPHLLRPLVGHRPSKLLLSSALGGATLCLSADICVRLLPLEPELKLGVLTSLLGAPFFLYLLIRMRRSHR